MTEGDGRNPTGYAGNLDDPSAHRIASGEIEAVFLPGYGMLGASLRHRGAELLGRIEDLKAMAAKGSAAGIPLLYPWANRLAGFRYRAADRDVTLAPSSPLLHLDENGLSIHGVPWSHLAWQVSDARPDRIAARLDWDSDERLAIFPFRHSLEMTATVKPDGLTVETTLLAGPDAPVPVSFGFHPYFQLPNVPRDEWRLTLPAMRRLALDGHQIPTGKEVPFPGMDGPLGTLTFDDGFAMTRETGAFSLAGGGRRITVELLEGYRYAQVFAPEVTDVVALEPMTAPANALASGTGLQVVPPGGRYKASFRVGIDAVS